MDKNFAWAAAAGRLLLSLIFIMGGIEKLSNPGGTAQYVASAGLPLAALGAWVAIVVELGGGILILAGFKTRWVAAAMALWCIVTALFFHTNFANTDMLIHFFKNLAMAGGFLQIVAFGAGPVSIDGRRAAS